MTTAETNPTASPAWRVNLKGEGLTEPLKEQIVAGLKQVFDPEIPVDVYELGLIYDVEVSPVLDVAVLMTLTSPNCPSAEQIPVDVERRMKAIAGVKEVKVTVTFDPPWTKEKMSPTALLELGMDL